MKSAEDILKPYIFEKAGKVNVNDALQAMHEYAAQDRWVKVSDRLPELIDGESEAVLACTKLPLGIKNEYMYHILKGYVYRTSKFWYWREDGTQCINEITHWQPLPTPPKQLPKATKEDEDLGIIDELIGPKD